MSLKGPYSEPRCFTSNVWTITGKHKACQYFFIIHVYKYLKVIPIYGSNIMTSKAKQKGNSWERAICEFLGENLGGHWMRVPNSGAYVGGKNVQRKVLLDSGQVRMVKGDIIAPENLPKMNLEAKNYSDIAFHQILNGNCKQLDAWIEQTEIPAEPGDLSLLIFKITRKGSWVVFRESLKEHFVLDSYVRYLKSDGVAYIVADYESFVITNKEKLIELGSNGTV